VTSDALERIRRAITANRTPGGLDIPGLDDDYLEMRRAADEPAMTVPTEKGIAVSGRIAGGIEVEVCSPVTPAGPGAVIYLHGGGFAFGNARTSRPYASALAAETALPVYSINYRLAPENPFPAAADDSFAVYRGLLASDPEQRLALVGESAGGNLALVVGLMASVLRR